jgi:uncharacterized RDD family membrane protein YckC
LFCSQCGHALDATTQVCPACGRATGVRPVAHTPSNSLPRNSVVPAIRVSYAGFWLRFLAWMIDEAMLVGIGFVVLGRLVSLARVGSIFRSFEPLDNMDDWYDVLGLGAVVFFFAAFVGISWLYHAAMESSAWQGTIGKRALGIVVTDLNGAKVDFWRASGRFFSRIVSNMIPLGIGYALAGFTKQKQALHDLISSCLVLRRVR